DQPWHDVQVRIEGSAVIDVELNFAERWEESKSVRVPVGLPELYGITGGRSGPATLQVIRTIPRPDPTPSFDALTDDTSLDPFDAPVRPQRSAPAPDEDFSTLESYGRAIVNAQKFIY